ncbi:3-methyl-2-oxobutanoate dehydrogenase subunit VorB [Ethanoligenens harbinense]|uniref:Pyruvate flavodoxin/ferredoxin oxidoreductase domain protein n=1 Tax=Ethanoligenens harbinense (strain DSM 18485 / JCM 12961 / CGMCC 1.5033 / YUAN-3) TaxID=663278 RepID=E6U785_ETHHY|nr:3-methyl-2-oxobutanoate dehydrogenase subunit VorB [Ethanoligenens harbinense]ADU25820.1 pyruvate flavodoxin/ferredoxin oxidoreductase domain protein [Ethanoligenens harbinense YUAN-3]AVQ94982.1 3-methyl-2-oxobutanoate dehydrogenase subunit VorB [Ethanoligenens harbinense YUAN-3]AYF37674.1 3-methyl-2-oxobutanoate dehydrogenase subunit VorB [Ethanoligenens harbinense]AYF40394.1 3-methyl-2-oxobutanoate dehydrogenase subunit VorB [Ethanoligenens harbinense]QCN91229.1 3-methyl-2-oxobutanoate de
MPEKVLMKGNEALAQAAIGAGCRHFFGYPITPQTEVSAYMAKRMPKIGGTYLQAESEVAAINMVYGAACAGVRAMTSSSSPGISLKSEGISYIAACDLPCLIVNVQRGGPGLGGIQPSQSDYWQATRAAGHGDFHLLVFAPDSVQEMVDHVFMAFDRSDHYRVPAMILSDGMLGQMMEPVLVQEPQKADLPPKTWATNGHGGKRPHNIINSLYLQPEELEELNFERFKKYDTIIANEQRSERFHIEDADLVVTAFGASARVAKSAVMAARAKGLNVGLLRPITLWPFPTDAFAEAAKTAKAFLSVEMNMGQMADDVRLAISCSRPVHFYGRTGGVIPTPAQVLAEIERILGGDR